MAKVERLTIGEYRIVRAGNECFNLYCLNKAGLHYLGFYESQEAAEAAAAHLMLNSREERIECIRQEMRDNKTFRDKIIGNIDERVRHGLLDDDIKEFLV